MNSSTNNTETTEELKRMCVTCSRSSSAARKKQLLSDGGKNYCWNWRCCCGGKRDVKGEKDKINVRGCKLWCPAVKFLMCAMTQIHWRNKHWIIFQCMSDTSQSFSGQTAKTKWLYDHLNSGISKYVCFRDASGWILLNQVSCRPNFPSLC